MNMCQTWKQKVYSWMCEGIGEWYEDNKRKCVFVKRFNDHIHVQADIYKKSRGTSQQKRHSSNFFGMNSRIVFALFVLCMG